MLLFFVVHQGFVFSGETLFLGEMEENAPPFGINDVMACSLHV